MKWFHSLALFSIIVLFAGCAGIDRQERRVLVQQNVSPVVYDRMMKGDPLSLSDVIELSRRQVPPGMVIRYLYSTRMVYTLDKNTLRRLREGGVNEEVVKYLQDTPEIFAPVPRYYVEPAYAPGPYYYGYPYRYYVPPPVIYVGGRWHR